MYYDVKDKEEWNKNTMDVRADRLANEIIKIFSIDQPQQIISFVDPRYKEYTCEEPENATNRSPNYYVLLGERVVVSNYADMLKSVIIKLYELDSEIIKQMARNVETIGDWSKIVMFSYDYNDVKGDYKIPNTNIYESTGFSAWYIMYIIKLLIEKYELSYDDFIYSARSTKKQIKG